MGSFLDLISRVRYFGSYAQFKNRVFAGVLFLGLCFRVTFPSLRSVRVSCVFSGCFYLSVFPLSSLFITLFRLEFSHRSDPQFIFITTSGVCNSCA